MRQKGPLMNISKSLLIFAVAIGALWGQQAPTPPPPTQSPAPKKKAENPPIPPPAVRGGGQIHKGMPTGPTPIQTRPIPPAAKNDVDTYRKILAQATIQKRSIDENLGWQEKAVKMEVCAEVGFKPSNCNVDMEHGTVAQFHAEEIQEDPVQTAGK